MSARLQAKNQPIDIHTLLNKSVSADWCISDVHDDYDAHIIVHLPVKRIESFMAAGDQLTHVLGGNTVVGATGVIADRPRSSRKRKINVSPDTPSPSGTRIRPSMAVAPMLTPLPPATPSTSSDGMPPPPKLTPLAPCPLETLSSVSTTSSYLAGFIPESYGCSSSLNSFAVLTPAPSNRTRDSPFDGRACTSVNNNSSTEGMTPSPFNYWSQMVSARLAPPAVYDARNYGSVVCVCDECVRTEPNVNYTGEVWYSPIDIRDHDACVDQCLRRNGTVYVDRLTHQIIHHYRTNIQDAHTFAHKMHVRDTLRDVIRQV
jgi:hypothetical protein